MNQDYSHYCMGFVIEGDWVKALKFKDTEYLKIHYDNRTYYYDVPKEEFESCETWFYEVMDN